MTNNRITVYQWTRGEILAMYTGPHSDRILELFGTNTLPTPFYVDSGLSEGNVRDRLIHAASVIQQQNPDVIVEWR